MKLSEFDYTYPPDLVAQHPLPERSASRMMVLDRKSKTWAHRWFRDIDGYLQKGDVLVLNDTKVFPARLIGKDPAGDHFEVLLLTAVTPLVWKCLVYPQRRVKTGVDIIFSPSLRGQVTLEEGEPLISFHAEGDLRMLIEAIGHPPLPPYIKRRLDQPPAEEDRYRYQTVYADRRGSAAAPTAGFHFTKRLLGALQEKGVEIVFVTLHVGRDTFQPVRTEDITQHPMHGEVYQISERACQILNRALRERRSIVAVGTTVVRALESACHDKKQGIVPGQRETRLFLKPGDTFRVVGRLLTNFHQPRSTLLMLVSAFAGSDLVRQAYAEAIRERYRLFSYGDCMLIL